MHDAREAHKHTHTHSDTHTHTHTYNLHNFPLNLINNLVPHLSFPIYIFLLERSGVLSLRLISQSVVALKPIVFHSQVASHSGVWLQLLTLHSLLAFSISGQNASQSSLPQYLSHTTTRTSRGSINRQHWQSQFIWWILIPQLQKSQLTLIA